MTVFRTFLKILNKCKVPIIMYTVFLIIFGGLNMSTSDTSTGFVAKKPDVLIINNDENTGITKNLVNYIKKNSNIKKIKNNENAISDALFYRDINYIIYIPKDFRNDFLNKKNTRIEVKGTGDYLASLSQMMLDRYLKIANIYNNSFNNENEIINNINNTLENETKIEVTSKLDTGKLNKSTFYFNFANYSLLAGAIYVICLILSSFKSENINKRTIISSMDYKKYNRYLLLSNSLFAIFLWIFYIILSIVLLGNTMFSMHGLIYMINSFIFTICALSIAFLIGNLINNKDAINGIVNVMALGASFLCGAFVPMEFLPNAVLNIAYILPSYWYIKTNELIKTIEIFNFDSLKPILINMLIMIIFIILFIALTNIVSRKKRKIN